ncbi:MAG: pentapeptide repeat-containing protein, partial [Paracoccaceae bacterium]
MAEPQGRKSGGGVNAILFFGFGIAAGVLLAFSGVGYVQNSAALIATVFLSALMVILLLGVIIYAARRLIWTRLFGFAAVQMEELANPLTTVAERALAGDATGATGALRELVALVLSRYSWITTRRWIIASLTALIAAMAALAGTALLFQQNKLLEVQSGLLVEQNARISEQTALLAQDVQLAEASRNAQLAVEITEIAAALGEVVDRTMKESAVATGTGADNPFNVLLPGDLGRDLVLRITSVSRATKPYRFLDLGVRAQTLQDKLRIAVQRRRDELPNTYARFEAYNGWIDPAPTAQLIDRPASPERGQLLSVLIGAGVLNLEILNEAGMDLSHAHLPNADIVLMTAQGGRLDSADFTGSHLAGVDLGGAMLENARFHGCVITAASFATVTEEKLRPPYQPRNAPMTTRANGIDFRRAAVVDTSFANAQLLAANFDDSLLIGVDFSGASPALATFRRT